MKLANAFLDQNKSLLELNPEEQIRWGSGSVLSLALHYMGQAWYYYQY